MIDWIEESETRLVAEAPDMNVRITIDFDFGDAPPGSLRRAEITTRGVQLAQKEMQAIWTQQQEGMSPGPEQTVIKLKVGP